MPRVGELRTRGDEFKVRWERFDKITRDDFFTQMVVDVWNDLPGEVAEAGTIPKFESHLGKIM